MLVPAIAVADGRLDSMREAHKRAMQHFNDARWNQAAAELREAYAVFPAAGLLYDQAICRERLGDKDGAAQLYRSYLAQAQTPPDRPETERRIAALRLGMDAEPPEPGAVVIVESTPPGMSVHVDDRDGPPAGRTPWSGHLQGAHTIILVADGYQDVYRAIDARPRSVVTLEVEAGRRALAENQPR